MHTKMAQTKDDLSIAIFNNCRSYRRYIIPDLEFAQTNLPQYWEQMI